MSSDQPLLGRVNQDPRGLKMEPVLEQYTYKRLAQNILKIALKDLGHKKPEVALDAALFLAGPDLGLFLAVALDRDDIEGLRDSGCKVLAGADHEKE